MDGLFTVLLDDVVVQTGHAWCDVVGQRHGLGPGRGDKPRELLQVSKREAVRRAAETLDLQGPT